jgi:hypothetical protein
VGITIKSFQIALPSGSIYFKEFYSEEEGDQIYTYIDDRRNRLD